MKTIYWEDIGMGIVAEFEERDTYLEFELFEVIAKGQDKKGEFTVNCFELKGAQSSSEQTEKTEEAQTLIRGTIKWDCCSHIYFGDEEGYIHMCGTESWTQVIESLKRVYEYAKDYHSKEEGQGEFFDSLTKSLKTNE